MSLVEQLAAHHQRVQAAKTRAREVDLEVRAAAAKVEEARNALIEAHTADADAATTKKLERALAAAQGEAELLREAKLVGVQRGVVRAEMDRQTFARQHFADLVAERRPEAEAVAQGFEDAMSSLHARHSRWLAMEREMMDLCRLAGHQTGGIPRFPDKLATFVRDVSRAGGLNVPAPFPGGAHATPLPEQTKYPNEAARRPIDRDVIDFTEKARNHD